MRISDWSSDVCSSDLENHKLHNYKQSLKTLFFEGQDGHGRIDAVTLIEELHIAHTPDAELPCRATLRPNRKIEVVVLLAAFASAFIAHEDTLVTVDNLCIDDCTHRINGDLVTYSGHCKQDINHNTVVAVNLFTALGTPADTTHKRVHPRVRIDTRVIDTTHQYYMETPASMIQVALLRGALQAWVQAGSPQSPTSTGVFRGCLRQNPIVDQVRRLLKTWRLDRLKVVDRSEEH